MENFSSHPTNVFHAINHFSLGIGSSVDLSAVAAVTKSLCGADLKFIVNDLLLNLPFLKTMFVGVNKFGKNQTSVRQQISSAFNADHALCIFPAGKVSRRVKGNVEDLEWKRTFVLYARELNREIIPIFIDGELSNFFYRLSNFRQFIGVKSNIEMFYFSSFDESWKVGDEGDVGAYWGLWDKNEKIKFIIF